MKVYGSNQQVVTRDVRREADGTWGVNVWSGSQYVTDVRRYFYSTRDAARKGDISDAPGRHGRVG